MKKYFICDDFGNQQGPYSEHVLQVLHEESSIRSDTRIREIQSSEWGTYSDIAESALQDKSRKDMDESSYLITLPDGETEGPYTKEQIKALYRNGRLDGNLLCCKRGASSWEPLETLIGKILNSLFLLKFQEELWKEIFHLSQVKATRVLV